MKELKNNKVVLGFSGGVDSTTAALLLKEQGYEVIGFYFDVLGNNAAAVEEATRIAKQIGIKLVTKDVSQNFNEIVIKDFCQNYINGKTPNPCVVCNPNIKFKELIDVANEEGAFYIATGHYVSTQFDKNTNTYFLCKGINERKDQSYMLYRLTSDVLERLLLPIGEISSKEEVRNIALNANMENAQKKDSQEICFIDETKESHTDFIKKKGYKSDTGYFINKKGEILGNHKGLINYTIGQRKGLGITLGHPVYVTNINYESNTITLSENEDLFKTEVLVYNNFFTSTSSSALPKEYENKEVHVKIRYAHKPTKAKIYTIDNQRIKIEFYEAQRAITPGQSAVIYDGNKVIGGGIIL